MSMYVSFSRAKEVVIDSHLINVGAHKIFGVFSSTQCHCAVCEGGLGNPNLHAPCHKDISTF